MSPPVTAGATREVRKPRKIDIVIKPSKRFFLDFCKASLGD
jgi:hypothetical protein